MTFLPVARSQHLVARLAIAFSLATTLLPAHASAQSATVNGTLTVLERPGASRNDLATAVIYLEALDAGATDDRGAAATDGTIAMRGREFLPRTAVIRRGGTVSFPNQDPFSHNVFSNTEPASFDLGLYRRGATRSATFAQPGVYAIHCNIHARMVSYVIAVPGRHVAFASPDGRFQFVDVPAGTYRLHAWHERAPVVTENLTITGTGATLRLTLDARGYVSGAHRNKFGMPYSTTRADRY